MTTMVSGLVACALGANAQGAATAAENETLNNWLNHLPPKPMSLSQADQYQQAAATGDGSTQDKLAALSAQNDQNLAQACANGPSAGCQVQIQAAQAGGNVVTMKPLGNGQYFTYANPLSGMAGPENFPFSYANGPQITALPSGPSLGAATLDTMLGSPLAGAFGGLVYVTGGSNASSYPVTQVGAATDGIMAGFAGFRMPGAPTLGATSSTGLGSALNGIYSSASPMNEVFPELNGVNPYYVENAGPGVNTNCVSCVNATQARLTGQDPNAVASPSNGYSNLTGLLPSAPFGFGEVTSSRSVVSEMQAAGNGATRPLIIMQPGNALHVINVVNSGGQVYFIDPQIGKIVTLQPNVPVRLGNAP